ncbi:hypothetical protein D9613_011513 [Agrocybe pediades]|uniref:Mitochondrial ATPase complex subunit ATP10 n=1 Tax=Agrocybe pediades TaxID=84607 RepID=A0A8H4QVC7_9AGAR|nr:hypothetical protein D9613_011513 [Agrocybe pediades]
MAEFGIGTSRPASTMSVLYSASRPLRRTVLTNQGSRLCFRKSLHASSIIYNEAKSSEESNSPPAPENDTLPLLNRPLGVRKRPTTDIKPTVERIKDFMNHDALMAQRRHLIKEAGKGYFHDLNMTRKNGGKTWIAPKVLIREDKSLYLPNISGTSLEDGEKKDTTTMCFGKISILAMIGTQISEAHVKSFTYAAHPRFSSNPLYQFVQINLQENLLKSLLVKVYSRSLRGVVPRELRPTYLISNQNMEYLRDPLGMTNSKVGYVFLIDENLKIRWAGSGDATLEEAQSLESRTAVLLKRLEEKKEKEKLARSEEEATGAAQA